MTDTSNGIWIINGQCEDCAHNERLEAHDSCCDCWCHDEEDEGDDG